jgi:hypothetical protein
MLRLWLFLVLTLAGAFAPSRASARLAETRTWDFFPQRTQTHQQTESQVADPHQGNLACGYELASGYSHAAESAAAPTYEDMITSAQDAYPGKAGKIELHLITPKYLGGDPEGPLVAMDAASFLAAICCARVLIPARTRPPLSHPRPGPSWRLNLPRKRMRTG